MRQTHTHRIAAPSPAPPRPPAGIDSPLQALLALSRAPGVAGVPAYSAGAALSDVKAKRRGCAAVQHVRRLAHAAGQRAYAAGPGRKRPRGWEALPDTDPVFQREKKTRSAYLSRFRAREYERLLEAAVATGAAGNVAARAAARATAAENDRLRHEIRRLQAAASLRDRTLRAARAHAHYARSAHGDGDRRDHRVRQLRIRASGAAAAADAERHAALREFPHDALHQAFSAVTEPTPPPAPLPHADIGKGFAEMNVIVDSWSSCGSEDNSAGFLGQ